MQWERAPVWASNATRGLHEVWRGSIRDLLGGKKEEQVMEQVSDFMAKLIPMNWYQISQHRIPYHHTAPN